MALIRPRFDSWWHHSKKEIHSGLFFVPAGIQTGVLAARATIISDETDKERTCLLGSGAGRSPIDRVIGGLRERVLIAHVWSMLFLRL